MSLDKYIAENYQSNRTWFTEEVKQPFNVTRVSKVLNNKNYLKGLHAITSKPDVIHKGVQFNTSKMILQTIKTIINFHATYVLGRPVSLVGTADMVSRYNQVYRKGGFHKSNFNIIDNVLKFGDCFEYIYYESGKIKSRLIDSADGYPVYSDSGEYIGFIEYYQDVVSNIESYTIFSDLNVSVWNNEGGTLHKVNEYPNLSGLPVHYKNTDEMFGVSILDDIRPIMDKIETVINRLDDSVYTLSMNPIGVLSGQSLSGSAESEGIGFVLSLEDGGQFQWAVANLDSESCKLLLNTLFNQLWTIAQVPSIVMGQSNVANVSEVSLKLLFSLAHNKGLENTIYLRDGFNDRHEGIEKILNRQGITFNELDYIDVEFTLNRPTDDAEIVDMLSKQFADGTISIETYLDKSPLINDVGQVSTSRKKCD